MNDAETKEKKYYECETCESTMSEKQNYCFECGMTKKIEVDPPVESIPDQPKESAELAAIDYAKNKPEPVTQLDRCDFLTFQAREGFLAGVKYRTKWMMPYLPDCMIPDGASPCKGFLQGVDENEKLAKELNSHKISHDLINRAALEVNTLNATNDLLDDRYRQAMLDHAEVALERDRLTRELAEKDKELKAHNEYQKNGPSLLLKYEAELAERDERISYFKREFESACERVAYRDEEIERLKNIVQKFKPWGSDACSECDEGRITLFCANPKCIHCAPETYEIPTPREGRAK